MDKKEIIVSTIAGLAVIFVGYLVWRHEETISVANAQAQEQANQDASDQFAQQIESLQTAYGYSNGTYGGGASTTSAYPTDTTDTGSTALATPAAASSNLAAILSAFFPSSTPANSSTDTANTSTPVVDTGTTNPTSTDNTITNLLAMYTANQPTTTTLPTSNTKTGSSIYSTPSLYPSSVSSVPDLSSYASQFTGYMQSLPIFRGSPIVSTQQ